jgi:hypothetical protein
VAVWLLAVAVGAMALVVAAFALPASAAPVTGAIFTTNVTSDYVNQNIYDNKEDVYLNGGPMPKGPNHDVDCSAAGLPDGDYYFQVTDPSGMTLLSTDTIDHRKVTVTNGVITAVDDHATGTGKCNSLSAQLMPFDDTPNPGGEYKVWMTPVGSYDPLAGTFGFLNSQSKTDNFKVKGGDVPPEDVVIGGSKFYDADADGIWDPNEQGLGGWRIQMRPPEPPRETDTVSTTGLYSFIVPPFYGNPDPVAINEAAPPNGFYPGTPWINTTATSGQVTVGDTDVDGPNFGNVCLGAGGGLTLGFWSNPNGQRLINASDLAGLRALNLVNKNGSAFDPTTNTQVKNWLLSADATNMAYMLSAQLAAMKLNVLHGFVSGSASVYAPGLGPNNSNFITISSLMDKANTELGLPLHNVTKDGSPYRAYQEKLKNALDQGNNNLNFVQTTPCAVPVWPPLAN